MNQKFNKLKAFTIIELLVVIGIIGILSAIGVVSFGAVREKARRGACIATLRSNFNSDENLVAYWNFDESLGTQENCSTVKDFWGNNGTCNGGLPNYTVNNGGIIDYALSFNKTTGDYVQIADSAILKPTSAITLSAWIKPVNPSNGYQMIIDKQTGGGVPAYTLRLDNSTGKILFRTSGTSAPNLLGNIVLLANIWYQVTGVYNGSSSSIYINDALDNSQSNNGSITYDTTPISIGRRVDGYYFDGLIDEVIIYNRALSADEIASHYKACKK